MDLSTRVIMVEDEMQKLKEKIRSLEEKLCRLEKIGHTPEQSYENR